MPLNRVRAWTFKAITILAQLAGETPVAAQEPGIGPTSRASIAIRVSVAERAGVRVKAVSREQATDLSGAQYCVWSTARVPALTLRLEPLAQLNERGPARRILLEARAPNALCRDSEDLGHALATLQGDRSTGSYLLILSPE
jgi:hypothetical protein